jgi:hypothetical protein
LSLLKLHALKLLNASAQFHHMLEKFTQWEAACTASLAPFVTRLIMIFYSLVELFDPSEGCNPPKNLEMM